MVPDGVLEEPMLTNPREVAALVANALFARFFKELNKKKNEDIALSFYQSMVSVEATEGIFY